MTYDVNDFSSFIVFLDKLLHSVGAFQLNDLFIICHVNHIDDAATS